MDFPEEIDLSAVHEQPMKGPLNYKLSGVVEHQVTGRSTRYLPQYSCFFAQGSMGGGHYVAYVRMKADDTWWYISDGSVATVTRH